MIWLYTFTVLCAFIAGFIMGNHIGMNMMLHHIRKRYLIGIPED